MEKYRTSIYLLLMLLLPNIMKAEGQDGVEKLFLFIDLLMIISNGFIFTIFLGFLIRLMIIKVFKNLNHFNLISFSLALIIVVLLQVYYQEKFTYLIYNNL